MTMNVISRNHRQPRLLGMFFVFGVLFCAFLLTPSKALSEVPRGVFCLLPAGQGTGRDPFIYSDPDVDGVSVRQDWADLEPIEGVYDWRFLDQVIAKAAAAGKPVLVRGCTGGGGIALGGNWPAWVMNGVAAEPLSASQEFYNSNDGGSSVT